MAPIPVDLIIEHGYIVTMDPQNRCIEDGAVAVLNGAIVCVDSTAHVQTHYQAQTTLDARHKVVMPGLIDTYGHAGHGMVKGIRHPELGWPTNPLYFHATTEKWWYAEGLLSALERLRFGVTCGFSVIGATPARMDSPVFAERQAQAVAEVGIRGVLGVGPPDPYISHLPEPWTSTIWDGETPQERIFTFDDAMRNTVSFIKRWHNAAGGRVQAALHYPYLFGRLASHPRIPFIYDDSYVPLMIEKAEEVREVADRHQVLLHSHAFNGSLDFAVEKYGIERVHRLLATPLVLAHCNGLAESEVAILGEASAGIAVVPFTHENVLYNPCPVVELLQAGANVTISTDGTAPYCSYDLFKEISRAMWTQWMAHTNQHILPPGKALRMVTIDAARALGLEQKIGSLEVSKRADIILIDMNKPHLIPTTHVPRLLAFYINGNDVDTVIVDGQILMRERQIQHIDETAIMEMVSEEAQRAFQRFDVSRYLEIDDEFWLGPAP
ncbi:MAG: amidohydrolase family protein [Chloroflexota bacterium]